MLSGTSVPRRRRKSINAELHQYRTTEWIQVKLAELIQNNPPESLQALPRKQRRSVEQTIEYYREQLEKRIARQNPKGDNDKKGSTGLLMNTSSMRN